MMVQLTDISQGVSLDGNGTQVNRLHFKTDTGKTFSVKVPHESLQELLQAVYGEAEESRAPVDEPVLDEPEPTAPEETEDATSFGEDEGGEEETVEEQEHRHRREIRQMRAERLAAPEAPQSEDEVPSL